MTSLNPKSATTMRPLGPCSRLAAASVAGAISLLATFAAFAGEETRTDGARVVWMFDFETPAQTWDAGFYSPMEPPGWWHGSNLENGFAWAANNNGRRPAGGIVKTSGSDGLSRSGTQALYFEAAGGHSETKHNTFVSFHPLARNGADAKGALRLNAGESITLSGWVRFENWQKKSGGNHEVYLCIRLRDAGKNEILYKDQGLTPRSEWTRYEVSTPALDADLVARATTIEFVLNYIAWNAGSVGGTAYVDDLEARFNPVRRPLPSRDAASLKAQITTAEAARGAYRWIQRQQGASGLCGNQPGETFSGLYVDALAAFCFIHAGEIDRAEKIFDTLDAWRTGETDGRKNWDDSQESLRGFPQFWNSETGAADLNSDRWVGDNAWLLLALEFYAHKTAGPEKYLETRLAITRWLLSLQDPADGGVKSGFSPRRGAMAHKSTEGNLDIYGALRALEFNLARAPEGSATPSVKRDIRAGYEGVYRWLTEKMYVPAETRFRTGSTMDASALDCSSWAVCVLGKDYAATLDYAERHYAMSAPYDAIPGSTAAGFGDMPGERRIWFEGTGEMIVAYRAAGRERDARRWLDAMTAAAIGMNTGNTATVSAKEGLNGGAGIGWPCFSNQASWANGSRVPFMPSVAWFLLGYHNLNPMNHESWTH